MEGTYSITIPSEGEPNLSIDTKLENSSEIWPTFPFGVGWMIGYGEGYLEREGTEIYRASLADVGDGYRWFSGSLTADVTIEFAQANAPEALESGTIDRK